MLVAGYLLAIVLANLSSANWGPKASIINAFLFIGFDITCRDSLHELWHGKQLALKMAGLIVAGSIISYALNRNAGIIAVASVVAFSLSASIDALTYALLKGHSRMLKINGSNVASSFVDSIVFPTIAFGSIMPWIMLGQLVAKLTGGFVWSLIIFVRKTRRVAIVRPITGEAKK